MARKPLMVVAAALLAVAPLASGGAASPPWVEAQDEAVTPLGFRADALDGATLYGEGGEAIGEIEKVLASRDGLIAGLAVEVGGFLGIGERHVVLRFDQVHRDGDRVATRLSRAQLEAQPRWDPGWD